MLAGGRFIKGLLVTLRSHWGLFLCLWATTAATIITLLHKLNFIDAEIYCIYYINLFYWRGNVWAQLNLISLANTGMLMLFVLSGGNDIEEVAQLLWGAGDGEIPCFISPVGYFYSYVLLVTLSAARCLSHQSWLLYGFPSPLLPIPAFHPYL